MSGTIFVNPHSGAEGTDLDELRRAFHPHDVEECEPDELERRVRSAVENGAGFVGVAGGDGTINVAASVLAGGSVPLLVIPGGTRNHFAKTLGLDTIEASAEAVEHGSTRPVDLGSVNGRWFVNNASIGLYPAMVRRREHHERRWHKGLSNLIAIWEQLRHGRRFVVEVDGLRHAAWAVFIGNGCYGEGLADLERESLDGGVLDLRVVRHQGRWSRARVLGATLTGRLSSSPLVERVRGTEVRVNLGDRTVDVALDGEVVDLDSPLDFQLHAGTLLVLASP